MDRNDFTIRPVSEDCIEVSFGNTISEELNDRVMSLRTALESAPFQGMTECVPAYSSVAVCFDPCRTGAAESSVEIVSAAVAERVRNVPRSPVPDVAANTDPVEIPAVFGGEAGPDLTDVAALHGIGEDEVIDIFLSGTYRVYMIGFLPGFAYMGTLDPRIATPRKEVPRTRVPAGSIGIAGSQTGVYPFDSPGGWQLIGRTNQRMFDPDPGKLSLLCQGDRVRFTRDG